MKEFREVNEKHTYGIIGALNETPLLNHCQGHTLLEYMIKDPYESPSTEKNRKEWLKSILFHLPGMTQFPVLWQCSFCFYKKKKKSDEQGNDNFEKKA